MAENIATILGGILMLAMLGIAGHVLLNKQTAPAECTIGGVEYYQGRIFVYGDCWPAKIVRCAGDNMAHPVCERLAKR